MLITVEELDKVMLPPAIDSTSAATAPAEAGTYFRNKTDTIMDMPTLLHLYYNDLSVYHMHTLQQKNFQTVWN